MKRISVALMLIVSIVAPATSSANAATDLSKVHFSMQSKLVETNGGIYYSPIIRSIDGTLKINNAYIPIVGVAKSDARIDVSQSFDGIHWKHFRKPVSKTASIYYRNVKWAFYKFKLTKPNKSDGKYFVGMMGHKAFQPWHVYKNYDDTKPVFEIKTGAVKTDGAVNISASTWELNCPIYIQMKWSNDKTHFENLGKEIKTASNENENGEHRWRKGVLGYYESLVQNHAASTYKAVLTSHCKFRSVEVISGFSDPFN